MPASAISRSADQLAKPGRADLGRVDEEIRAHARRPQRRERVAVVALVAVVEGDDRARLPASQLRPLMAAPPRRAHSAIWSRNAVRLTV